MHLGSRLGLGAICLGLSPVGLVSGLEPLPLVETFCAGMRRTYCSCSSSDTNQHDICGLDIFVYSVFNLSFTYLS